MFLVVVKEANCAETKYSNVVMVKYGIVRNIVRIDSTRKLLFDSSTHRDRRIIVVNKMRNAIANNKTDFELEVNPEKYSSFVEVSQIKRFRVKKDFK